MTWPIKTCEVKAYLWESALKTPILEYDQGKCATKKYALLYEMYCMYKNVHIGTCILLAVMSAQLNSIPPEIWMAPTPFPVFRKTWNICSFPWEEVQHVAQTSLHVCSWILFGSSMAILLIFHFFVSTE